VIKTVFNSILYREEDRIPDLIQVRQLMYLQPEMKRAMDNILVLQEPEVRERNILSEDEWRSIKAPTLIILAPDDNADYYTTGLRACELIPSCQSVTIKQVKHWAQFEQSEVFNSNVIAFLSHVG
jgi:pimeloyl-ACP methyl ester carboxylesterase